MTASVCNNKKPAGFLQRVSRHRERASRAYGVSIRFALADCLTSFFLSSSRTSGGALLSSRSSGCTSPPRSLLKNTSSQPTNCANSKCCNTSRGGRRPTPGRAPPARPRPGLSVAKSPGRRASARSGRGGHALGPTASRVPGVRSTFRAQRANC